MKTLLLIFSTLFLLLILSSTVFAQNPPALPFMSPSDQAPIDGGLSLLAAAGGAYAYKKLRERKSENEPNSGEL